MLIAQETSANTFVEIMPGASFRDADDVLHGWQVAELWSDDELADIGVFRVAPAQIPEGRVPSGYGFERDGDGNVVQVLTLEPLDLPAYAADKRWQKEVGGIIFNGVPIATDDRSKQMIMGARVAADADANFTTPWVGVDGNVYPLDAQSIIAISNAVLQHVANCFSIFASVKAQIDSNTITTTQQIDEAFA